MRIKRRNKIEDNKTREDEVKKREEKLKKKLVENRKLERIMSGQDNLINPEVILTEVNLAMESNKTKENNYVENSNLLQAINSATENFIKKGGNLITETNLTNDYIKNRNKLMLKKYQLNEEKKKDDVFNKFGKIESVDIKKRKDSCRSPLKATFSPPDVLR